MTLVAGYFLSYADTRAVMNKLRIPDKGVDDKLIQHPINDWLFMKKRFHVVCNTIGNIYSDCKEAEGVLLITHVKMVRQRPSQGVDLLRERDRDKNVRRWLIREGEVKEERLRWMSFRDGDQLGLLSQGVRPRWTNLKGARVVRNPTPEQSERRESSGKTLKEWDAEVTTKGEVVDRECQPPR
jgi:hypothetical protein